MADPEPALRVEDIHKSFGNIKVLRGISLEAYDHNVISILGSSGSGKSTMMNILGCLDRLTSGHYYIEGQEVSLLDDDTLSELRLKHLGFIFQSFNLLPRLTAVENVAIPLTLAGVPQAERQERAKEMLKKVGLGHRLDHYPSELSGGEQQRTAVARALIHKPSLILADEPTGELDSATGRQIMSLFQTISIEENVTVVMVTHDPVVEEYSSLVYHLNDGQVAEVIEHPENKVMPH